MKPRIKHPKLNPHHFPEAMALAQLVGRFIEYWGFKAVQGRIWCYLFLSKRPLNSRELAQLAQVSAALVTQSVKVLLDYEVILEAGKGPNGMLLFRANPNAATAIAKVLAGREAVLLKQIGQAANKVAATKSPKPPKPTTNRAAEKNEEPLLELDPKNCAQIAQWITIASGMLSAGLDLLREEKNPLTRPDAFSSAFGEYL
jgi:DNA-binding transcriptional regulator GbsR (MarR family)